MYSTKPVKNEAIPPVRRTAAMKAYPS